jgi:hypothetical protein
MVAFLAYSLAVFGLDLLRKGIRFADLLIHGVSLI